MYMGCHNTRSYIDHPLPTKVPEALRSSHIHIRRFLYDHNFYLAFIPQPITFNGKVLSCLNVSNLTLPLEEVDRRPYASTLHDFQLHPALVQQWQDLELTILHLEQLLWNRALLLPLELELPMLPSTFRQSYTTRFSTREAAQRVAMAMKTSFLMHFAFISFLVCARTVADDSNPNYPRWAATLLDAGLLSDALYADLSTTWVFDLTVRRIGGFVCLDQGSHTAPAGPSPSTSTQWFSFLPQILAQAFRLPVWICVPEPLPNTHDESRWRVCRRYLPLPEQIDRLSLPMTQGSVIPSNPPSSPLAIGDEERADVMTYPTKEDKSFDVFFEQLRLWIEWQIQRGGATARRAAERLLEQQNTSQYPDQRIKVWEWQISAGGQWHFEARSSQASHRRDLWAATTSNQRIFDPFHLEYHVSKQLPSGTHVSTRDQEQGTNNDVFADSPDLQHGSACPDNDTSIVTHIASRPTTAQYNRMSSNSGELGELLT